MLNWLRDISRRIVGNQLFISLLGLGLFYWLYLYKLGTTTVGLSRSEFEASQGSSSLLAIIHNPVYAPHKLLQFGFRELFGYNTASLRLVSVIFAGIFLVCFYILCARWFGRLIGTVSTVMLGSLPWFSLLGRNATPSIMLMISSLILLSYYWFARSRKFVFISWLVFCLCASVALYVPGLIWALLVGALIIRHSLIFSIKRLSIFRILAGVMLILILIAPLIWSFIKTPSLLHHWLLIPTAWIGFEAFAKNFGWALSSLFVRTHSHIDWSIGRSPIITIAATSLAIFGGYAMSQQARQKLYAIIALATFGCLTAAANSNFVYLSFTIVPLALLAAAGLRFLYLQWHTVFPKNPLPRYFAYALIVLLAATQLIYGVRATVFAWPHTPETKTIFVIK